MLTLNRENFEQQVLQAQQPVLVEFWAPWCTYCRRINAAYEKTAEQNEGKLTVAKVNIDEAPQIAEQEQIELVRPL